MKKLSRRHVALGIAFGACTVPSVSSAQTEAEAVAKKLMEAIPPHGEKALGDPNAPIVMIEYASATCPHCAEFHNDIWPEIKKDYVDTGKVYFVFREFPTDQLAMGAFMLARCVPEDKYFTTIDTLFELQSTWVKSDPKKSLFRIVGMAGLNAEGAEACIQKEELAKSIFETRKIAFETFNVKGTPSFFINGVFVNAHDDAAAVRKTLDDELKRLGKN